MIYLNAILIVVALATVLVWLFTTTPSKAEDSGGIMIILGSGGHTTELLKMLNSSSGTFNFGSHKRIYVLAENDGNSRGKLEEFEMQLEEDRSWPQEERAVVKEKSVSNSAKRRSDNRNGKPGMADVVVNDFRQSYEVFTIPRSRNVHQSWLTTPLTTLYSFLACIRLVSNSKPDLIICNGPGTCVPLCFAAILCDNIVFRRRKIASTRILFIESFARVKGLSLTGKILLNFADRFIVQWPQLAEKYAGRGKTLFNRSRAQVEYLGRLL